MGPKLAIPLVVTLWLGAACGSDDGDRTVLVFAASSLTDAFGELEAAFEAERPGVDVRLNLAASSALREQILEGAPADVFAAADEATMAALVAAGEVEADPVVFAANRLLIAVPAGNPAGVTSIDDFARPELLLGRCAAGVPCGDLARAVLDRAGVDAAVDSEEPNVRALTAKLDAGELDAGLVYATELGGPLATGVDGVPIAGYDDLVTTYPIVALPGAGPDAAAFVDFVRSADGQRILSALGFETP